MALVAISLPSLNPRSQVESPGVSLFVVEKAGEEWKRIKKKDSQRNLSFSSSGIQHFTQHSDGRLFCLEWELKVSEDREDPFSHARCFEPKDKVCWRSQRWGWKRPFIHLGSWGTSVLGWEKAAQITQEVLAVHSLQPKLCQWYHLDV